MISWPGTNPYLLQDDHFIDSTPTPTKANAKKPAKLGKAKKATKSQKPVKASRSTPERSAKKPTKRKKLENGKKAMKSKKLEARRTPPTMAPRVVGAVGGKPNNTANGKGPKSQKQPTKSAYITNLKQMRDTIRNVKIMGAL